MASRIETGRDGRRYIESGATGESVVYRIGLVLDPYSVTRLPWAVGPEPIGLIRPIRRLTWSDIPAQVTT